MLKIRILREAKEEKLSRIQQHNLDFITNNDEITLDCEELDLYELEDYVALVKNIPVLKKNKFVQYMTGRSYGKIFKLDNGHVFKMFSDSIDPREDITWYKHSLEKLHSGEAKKTTLPVFDVGEWSGISKPIYWVEMAEVMPYDKWREYTNRTLGSVDEFSVIVEFFAKTGSTNLEDLLKWLEKEVKNRMAEHLVWKKLLFKKLSGAEEGKARMTKEEMSGLLEALLDLKNSGFKMKDIFPRNVGVLKQSRPDKPIFVIFDN